VYAFVGIGVFLTGTISHRLGKYIIAVVIVYDE
jgi:hypothetical protein